MVEQGKDQVVSPTPKIIGEKGFFQEGFHLVLLNIRWQPFFGLQDLDGFGWIGSDLTLGHAVAEE